MGRVNKTRINIKALDEWMKALDRKISIKVGWIGKNAGQKVEGSDLTVAELAAVHEFGCTITVTEKMRNFLHSQGLHLRKDTTTVIIPTRSMLRASLMSPEGKKELKRVVEYQLKGELKAADFSKDTANKILDDTVHLLAEMAYLRVLQAFESGGFGKWAPITEFTAKRRYNASNPPLTDTGNNLRGELEYEIKETK